MDRLEFLKAEFINVSNALDETLRHDYGTDRSRDFFLECISRLGKIDNIIKNTLATDRAAVYGLISELNAISRFICFIERAHLGEFSWPFAENLTRMANALLSEKSLRGTETKPIISTISDGSNYSISYEYSISGISTKRKFVFVIFPRSLKHNVLFHVLFGHELGHASSGNDETGKATKRFNTHTALNSPLQSVTDLNSWLNDPVAPEAVKKQISELSVNKPAFYLTEEDLIKWHNEFMCDIFGLLLFGPSFVVAHKMIISHRESREYQFSRTHPPYETRHIVLRKAMTILGWDVPVLNKIDNAYLKAEKSLIEYIMAGVYPAWADIIDTQQLELGIAEISNHLALLPGISYSIPNPSFIEKILKRLEKRLPPICEEISDTGQSSYAAPHIGEVMYCGWIYWIGRSHLADSGLQFIDLNMLCEHGLLQQEAINVYLAG